MRFFFVILATKATKKIVAPLLPQSMHMEETQALQEQIAKTRNYVYSLAAVSWSIALLTTPLIVVQAHQQGKPMVGIPKNQSLLRMLITMGLQTSALVGANVRISSLRSMSATAAVEIKEVEEPYVIAGSAIGLPMVDAFASGLGNKVKMEKMAAVQSTVSRGVSDRRGVLSSAAVGFNVRLVSSVGTMGAILYGIPGIEKALKKTGFCKDHCFYMSTMTTIFLKAMIDTPAKAIENSLLQITATSGKTPSLFSVAKQEFQQNGVRLLMRGFLASWIQAGIVVSILSIVPGAIRGAFDRESEPSPKRASLR